MKSLKVLYFCLLVATLARSEEAEPKVDLEESDSHESGGSCAVGTDGCTEAGGQPTKNKYSEDKQKTESQDDDRGADTKEDDDKEEPNKYLAERHLVTVEVLEEGSKCERFKASNEQAVTVHLRGFKTDESVFMTTYNEDGSEGKSIPFRMGVGDSIKGLELGIIDMCIGEKRRLHVPASLVRNGRDEFAGDLVPRGEDLIFEVVLLGCVPNYQKGMPNLFKRCDLNEDGVLQRDEVYEFFLTDGNEFPRGAKIVDTLTDEMIAQHDKDKDGNLQWKEFHLPKWD